ncbi:MAG TPA: class I SAM-dependent methyltransferase [Thermoguttaceae bacterium]
MARLQFLYSVVLNRLTNSDRICPYCESSDTRLFQRKKIFLELRCCEQCNLMYRYPKDSSKKNRTFYQKTYREGMTTDFPEQAELERLLETNFAKTEKDLSVKINLVQRYGCGPTLLDFGCSWGYGLYQFRRAGFNALGFEISEPRACYGREKLGVPIISDPQELDNLRPASFDVIFCNHVLEHLPTPRIAFKIFDHLLAAEGTLFVFVPNCGGTNASRLGVRWGPMIGEKHVLALNAEFISKALQDFNFSPIFSSSPYGNTALNHVGLEGTLLGDELMVAARRKW